MLEISADALKVLGGILIGFLSTWLRTRQSAAKRCEKCPEHAALEARVRATETALARIDANITNLFHRIDDLKTEIKELSAKIK